MDWIEFEPLRFNNPLFADELVGRQALEGFQPSSKIAGADEVGEVLSQLVMVVVVEAFDGGVLDCAVHTLDLAIRPECGDDRGCLILVSRYWISCSPQTRSKMCSDAQTWRS